MDDTQSALNLVRQLKSRGVTRYLDLQRVNRSQWLDVEEDEQRDDPDGPLNDDDEDLGGPPRQRLRIHPSLEDIAGDEYSPEWPPSPVPPADRAAQDELERNEVPAVPMVEQALPRDVSVPDPEPGEEPPVVSPHPNPAVAEQPRRDFSMLDPETRALYEPEDAEDFRRRRMRFDRQETLQFGPWRRRTDSTVAPYEATPPTTSATDADAVFDEAFPVEDLDVQVLPEGWHVDEHGYIQMDAVPRDYWEIGAGCLIRHHVVPRRQKLNITNLPKDCPIGFEKLDTVRVTVVKEANGKCKIQTDDGMDHTPPCDRAWLHEKRWRCTVMDSQCKVLARLPRTTNTRLLGSSRRTRTPSTREPSLQMREHSSKMKDLKSFFDNHVWVFDSVKNAEPSRTLTSRVLLKWSKNPDGSPRAKARLIVRGYTDPDALQGKVETSSPTTTRLARSMLFSMTANLSWSMWTADVSTAFLQGRPQSRQLWVKLPSEALALLGADEETRMLLLKPCYGQLDAPRGWYLEAVSRLLGIGLKPPA